MDKEKTGIFIKEQREKCGLTQYDLADKLNTSRENISKWERGLAVPNTEYLKKLCEVLNCNVIDLLTAGERNERVDKLIYDLIDKYVIFVKKVLSVVAVVIFFMILIFLVNYFCQNYNSVKIYNISGEMNGYKVLNSTLLVNKKKGFLTFNGFVAPDGEEIKGITIYYDDINDDHNVMYKSTQPPAAISFDIKRFDIKKIEDDLKVQMITSDNVITFDLDVYLYYKNNHLLVDNKNYVVDDNDELRKDLPSCIDENFEYNYKTDSYIYTYREDDIEVKIEYDYQTKEIAISEIKNDLEMSLSTAQQDIIWFKNTLGKECIYDANRKVCMNSDSKLDDIELIKSYLNKYKRYLA